MNIPELEKMSISELRSLKEYHLIGSPPPGYTWQPFDVCQRNREIWNAHDAKTKKLEEIIQKKYKELMGD